MVATVLLSIIGVLFFASRDVIVSLCNNANFAVAFSNVNKCVYEAFIQSVWKVCDV